MTDTHSLALAFVTRCRQLGWNYEVRGSIITITKRITPNDRGAFADADSEAFCLLDMVPLKGGSVWGTDGGSIGGMSAMAQGLYRLNKSGSTGKRILAAIQKI